MKILALQFKYFGDAVLMTPALRALRAHFPEAEIHLLAPEEIAPLFQHLPWLDRVWAMPRRRGRASLRETWPLIRALRRERFDRTVDFASNDRGAILSRLIGAKNRLGWNERAGFWGRRFCYNCRVEPNTSSEPDNAGLPAFHEPGRWNDEAPHPGPLPILTPHPCQNAERETRSQRLAEGGRVHGPNVHPNLEAGASHVRDSGTGAGPVRPETHRQDACATIEHESARLARLLCGWQIPMPASLEPEIRADPALAEAAKKLLPQDHAVVCHVASSQPRKEWPLPHWAEFHRLATALGRQLVFTTARGERETGLMLELKKLAPAASILPAIPDLPLFLAVLERAAVFISGDTGPLHFAAGLGVPTISIFGPTAPARWAPVGAKHVVLAAAHCGCDGSSADCTAARHCLADLSPESVLAALAERGR